MAPEPDDRFALQRLLRTVLAGLLLLAGTASVIPAAAEEAPASSSPSEPPFWARPRPTTPECACDKKGPGSEFLAPEPRPSRGPSFATLVLGAMVALLGFLLWRQRQNTRSKPEPETYVARADVTPAAAPAPAPANGLDPRVARMRVAPGPVPKAVVPATAPDEHMDLADPRTMQVELAGDAGDSGGAEGFYTEIAGTLIDALRAEPRRQDLRRKLLEVYFLARRGDDFVGLAQEYLDTNNQQRDDFWPDIGDMGHKLLPSHPLFAEFGPEADRPAPVVRSHKRRFHERNVDAGKAHAAQQQLTAEFQRLKGDDAFRAQLSALLADSVRRPAPLLASPELAYVADGAQIFIKHEDRRRGHDDVLINATAQLLMAQKLGRTRVVTATRDCVHGHAVASAAAKLGLECGIYISERDLNRYYTRVLGMRRLGAQMRPIQNTPEQPTDPRRSAMDAWLDDPERTMFISGLSAGPDPYPEMVREFLSVVGRETSAQLEQMAGVAPNAIVAGMADGHLGLGLLTGFLEQTAVQLFCVEEKPAPIPEEPEDSSLPEPLPPGVLTRREHRWLRDTRRVQYVNGDDQETLRVIEQFHATGTPLFTHSARTMAYARALARRRERKDAIVVLLVNQEAADMRGPRNDW